VADETREVGIVLTIRDAASRSLAAVGKAAKGVRKGVNKIGPAGTSALKGLGFAAVALNQGLELAKKGMELFRAAVLDTIEASMQFRAENDPIVKWFERVKKEGNLVRARIGDAMIPIFKAFTDTISQTSGRLSEYIRANRELIATKVGEWLKGPVASGIEIVMKGVGLVAKMWLGWKAVFLTLKIAFNEFSIFVIDQIKSLVKSLVGVTRVFPSIRKQLKDSYEQWAILGEVSADASKQAKDELAKLPGELNALDKAVESGTKTAVKFVNDVGDATIKNAKTMTEAQELTREEMQKTADKAKELIALQTEAINKHRDARIAAIDAAMARELAQAQLLDQQEQAHMAKQAEAAEAAKQRMLEQQQAAAETAQAIGETMGTAITGLATGTLTFRDVFKDVVAQVIAKITEMTIAAITANAANAASGAAASQAPIPVVGPALGIAAAGAMSAFVLAMANQFAKGGEVSGGVPGKDSVIAALTPGERVLTVEQNRMFKNLARSVGRPATGKSVGDMPAFANGGEVQTRTQASSAQGVQVNFSVNALTLPSAQQRKRLLTDLARDFEGAIRDGIIKIPQGARV
jgi:hypothetical protein